MTSPGPTSDAQAPRHPLRATHEAFESSELSVRAENCRRAIQTGVLFIPLGIITDIWIYPEFLTIFATVRILIALVIAFLLVPLRQPSQRSINLLTHVTTLLPILMVLWMIYHTGDPLCGYREGLSLIMVVAAMIVRWRLIDSLINAIFVLTSYTIIFHDLGGSLGDYLATTYFLLGSAVFSCLSCYLHTNLRHREFYLREEVEANRLALIANNDELQAISESKNRFFANISHELRTPLTLILGPIEQLSEMPALRVEPRALTYIETLSENSFRLLRLINDLLEVARLETGDLPERVENVDLQTFAIRTRRSLAAIAESKNIDFSVTTDLHNHLVQALDHDRLEKIISNLLVNALKFTPDGGAVSLKITESPGHLFFEVTDNGIGLSEEELQHIFERFWQGKGSTARRSRGAGIGLALAKNLTESMGGILSVRSSLGRGTTFRLTLPSSPEKPSLPAPPPIIEETEQREDAFDALQNRALRHDVLQEGLTKSADTPEEGRKKFLVLIIDDEESMRSYLSSFLNQHGILSCSSGEDGLKLARQHLPDLIILDYMMPGLNGIEVATQLRDDPATARIPILLITAHGGDAPRISALEAGVNDFLTKPFYSSELTARVQNLLLQHQYQSDLQATNENLGQALVQIREKEEELIRSEKLSSLGQMSAGIVHEINNPLNYAKTSLHLLKAYSAELPADQRDEYDETLADLEDALQRVIRIITDLRALTRGSEVLKFPISLQLILRNATRLLSHELNKVTFENQLPEDLKVLGNDNQLCQVFVNLIQNAIHATEGVENPVITINAKSQSDDMVRITLSDNGKGIPDDILGKIFDPFFTTKDVGVGTGLGLSLTLKIIHDHQGTVKVVSSPGNGTTFQILLPSPSLSKKQPSDSFVTGT